MCPVEASCVRTIPFEVRNDMKYGDLIEGMLNVIPMYELNFDALPIEPGTESRQITISEETDALMMFWWQEHYRGPQEHCVVPWKLLPSDRVYVGTEQEIPGFTGKALSLVPRDPEIQLDQIIEEMMIPDDLSYAERVVIEDSAIRRVAAQKGLVRAEGLQVEFLTLIEAGDYVPRSKRFGIVKTWTDCI